MTAPEVTEEQIESPSSEEQAIDQSPGTMAEAISAGMTQPEEIQQSEPAPSEVTPVETLPEETQPQIEAPSHWPEARREEFKSLPDNQKSFMMDTMRSQEADYTRKSQQLSEYRKTISDFVEKLPVQNQTQPEPEAEIPDDPIDRIKYDAKQEALEAMREEQRMMAAQKADRDREQLARNINNKIATDPMKDDVIASIRSIADNIPDVPCNADPQGRTYRQLEYLRLQNDPEYYGAMYLEARSKLQGQTQQPTAPAKPAAPNTVTQHRPHLERAGATQPVARPDQNVERKEQIVRDIKRGKVDSHTLGDYLSSVLG